MTVEGSLQQLPGPPDRASGRGPFRHWAQAALGLLCSLLTLSALAGQVRLAWDASTGIGVAGYYVHYGTTSGNYPARVNAGNALAVTVNSLAAGQTYYFAVTAYTSSGGESGYSNEASTTIPRDPSQTQLASSLNPAPYASPFSLVATVTGTAPTGSVQFTANGAVITGCSGVALAGSGNTRTATCNASSLAVGSYGIVAHYAGNAVNAPSSSAGLVQTVTEVPTATTLGSSPNPSQVGATVVFTATVSGRLPSGSVAFSAGGNTIAGCAARSLSGSGNTRTATCSTSALPAGNHAVVAAYGGDAGNGPSSGIINQAVYTSTPPVQTFADVPVSHWAYPAIAAVAYHGISAGCATGPLRFCPNELVARDAMAVFLERATRGPGFPYAPTGTRFADVPISHWAVGPIEQAYLDGITLGCASSPLRFCPDHDVSRAEMAIFLLRARFGAGYNPGTATGTVFSDVPANHWAAAWIERFASLGYTTGCASNPARFCPNAYTTRASMAVFLQRVFELAGPPP